jgi:ubiquinone/menaquinone biosynthesis C-methylase UbiE
MSTKAVQGKLWSIAPQYWSQYFEPWFLPMYKKVLEQLELNEEHFLLDAGCGAGLFSSLAIETGAHVMGVDAASGLLEVARRRNPQNSFLEEDLEALPFGNDSFDVVAGFNSFQYSGDFQKALVEARRVLKPGGRLVIAIWDKPEMSDATHVLKSISTLLPPLPQGTPGPFALSEDGRVEKILQSIGMKLNYKTSVACPAIYSTLADGIKSFVSTGPAAAAMNEHSRQTVEKTIAKGLRPFRVADDIHYLHNQFLVFIAKKQ